MFRPIVRLDDQKTVAYEALVRGPTGSRLASAPSLLTEAYRTGRVVELNWAARASACRAAMAAGLSPDLPLFLNIEPLALDSKCPDDLCEDIDAAYQHLKIVLEVTERSLDRDPRSLLDGVAQVRATAGGLAVDDVGANARTLSMLAILQPELIKLDLHVVQGKSTPAIAKILDCVYAESERTGATILAEGIQTARHAGRCPIRRSGARAGPIPWPAAAHADPPTAAGAPACRSGTTGAGRADTVRGHPGPANKPRHRPPSPAPRHPDRPQRRRADFGPVLLSDPKNWAAQDVSWCTACMAALG